MNRKSEYSELIERMKEAQKEIYRRHGVDDIFTSSKVFEILIASTLDHELLPGQSGTADATDSSSRTLKFEYKHFKEKSSNHSWTFNDFSDSVIEKVRREIDNVFFCHINDIKYPPKLDWYFNLTGYQTAEYLDARTPNIKNKRKMINISEKQIKEFFGEAKNAKKVGIPEVRQDPFGGKYGHELALVLNSIKNLEDSLKLKNLLTSSKLWELVVAESLGHFVNSEQGGRAGAHDAYDAEGNWYEYKVDKSIGWSFQDISDNVLNKYSNLEAFILAVVDKQNFEIKEIYRADSKNLIKVIRKKRDDKSEAYRNSGKEIRRTQVTVGKKELHLAKAERIL